MVYIVLGILIGFAIALGPLKFLAIPADHVTEDLIMAAQKLVNAGMLHFAHLPHSDKTTVVLSVGLSSVLPGFVAIILVLASKAMLSTRRAIGSIIVLGAFGSLFILPAASAILLIIAALILAAVLSFLEGVLVTLPLMILATIIGVRYTLLIWNGKDTVISSGAQQIAKLLNDGTQANTWKIALTLVALVPFACALMSALDIKPKKKSSH